MDEDARGIVVPGRSDEVVVVVVADSAAAAVGIGIGVTGN